MQRHSLTPLLLKFQVLKLSLKSVWKPRKGRLFDQFLRRTDFFTAILTLSGNFKLFVFVFLADLRSRKKVGRFRKIFVILLASLCRGYTSTREGNWGDVIASWKLSIRRSICASSTNGNLWKRLRHPPKQQTNTTPRNPCTMTWNRRRKSSDHLQ